MRKFHFAAVLVGLLLVAPIGVRAQDNSADTYRQLKLFSDVFERVRAGYVEEVTDKELIEFAIQGMLSQLDPHSSYLNADSYQDMRVQTRGEFGGLGIEVTMENGFVKVVSPIDDTPAHRAGIEAGDLITHLDGESVMGLTLNEAVDRMRGKVNTDLTLTIRRESEEPFEVVITRDVIKIRSVRSRAEGQVGYIRLTTFNQQTTPGLHDAVKKLREEIGEDIEGYVIDLRNNPGGLLDQAVSVSDSFLDQGEIVSTRGRDTDNAQRFNSDAGDVTDGKPVIVLINGGSASASEIVAGALQDHRRAIIMGTRSFGKGSVQTIIPLGAHGAMRLTTARYYTPSGRSIQAKGIEPDIEVEQMAIEQEEDEDDPRGRREEDLRGALGNDGGNGDAGDEEEGEEEGTLGRSEQAEGDLQLTRALDLLHALSIYNEQPQTN
jgi:carboxyl-terminal processing protease